MLLQIIRFFRGYVTFKIIGRFPERFINLALKNGIGIFGAVPKDSSICANMIVSDYRTVRPIARRSGVKLKVVKKHGLPFVIYRFRSRWGLGVGLLLFIIISLIMPNFVWSMELNGIKTISETKLVKSLDDAGFSIGKFKGGLDLHRIEREIQLEYKEIGWMSINLIGAHAEIEIKEKALVPEKEYSSQYSNIKASTDGIIISSNIKRGTAEVFVGSAVSEGQLLVSGMYENALGDIHFVDAEAEIIASTSYNFTATCDETADILLPDENNNRSSISFLWFDFPASFAPEKYPFSSYTESLQLYLAETPVPVLVYREHINNYLSTNISIGEEKAKNILNTEFALYKLFTLNNTRTMVEEKEVIKTSTGYQIKAKLSCTEDIALKENLIVNSE